MKKIFYRNREGLLSIITPTEKALSEMTIEEIAGKDVPAGLSYQIADIGDMPKDRMFRDAWIYSDSKNPINIDMTKARKIHMDNIRVARNKKLESLDVEYIKSIESNDTELKKSIAIKKKELRDIPSTFDLSHAKDTESLKNLWPKELE